MFTICYFYSNDRCFAINVSNSSFRSNEVLVVPESAISDSCLLWGELQHESFEWASRALEVKMFFTLMHVTVLHSMLF